MEKSEKFFIFTWKELLVMSLLVLTLVGFFFTLGLHYGKKISSPSDSIQLKDQTGKLEESPEAVPPRETLEESSNHQERVAADTIKDATLNELNETGVKIDQPKAVELPKEKAAPKKEKLETVSQSEGVEAKSAALFAIQLGSYPTKKEAIQKSKVFSKKGMATEIRTAEVNHVTRYRVVIPGFKSKASADQRGKELKSKHKIEGFIVIR